MSHICVPITADPDSPSASQAFGTRAAELGADLIEWRVDAFTDTLAVQQLVHASPLPCVLTCRSQDEGGQSPLDDAGRAALLAAACEGPRPPAYIDFEFAAYQRSPQARAIIDAAAETSGLILSTHDFETRPADLLRRLSEMAAVPSCRVVKAAWMARSLRDNTEAFELLAQRVKPMILLCMGEFGLASRVLAKKFGNLLTFAALDADAGTAPGQPTIRELKDRYRWDAQTRDTRVFGIIGWPVGHSMSPAIHNAGFDATGFDGIYLPMPIADAYESFKATVATWLDCAPLHFRGASVTIPHKQHLMQFAEEHGATIDPLTQRIGVANTLTVRDDQTLSVTNTDYSGALDALCAGMGIQRDGLKDVRIGVLGAGGAARAIVAGLAHAGARVVVYNRTLQNAEALVEAFKDEPGQVVAASPDALGKSCCDVFVNCTPLGMSPNVDATPMPDTTPLKPGVVAFDTIYNPLQTRWLKDAEAAGCGTVQGTEMFVRQAVGQFEGWTRSEAPLEVFRSTLMNELS